LTTPVSAPGAQLLDPSVLAKISSLELRARAVVEGFIQGLHRAPHLGASTDFAEHRPYMPGDDTRRIDWKLYARSDRYYVKEFEADTNTNLVVFLDVSRAELLRRLTGRRVCRQCGTPFHIVSAPPRAADRCDKCGGELYQRSDDSSEAVATRLDVYEKQTAPLLAYYRDRGLLAGVGGEGAMDLVAGDIRRAVGRTVTA